SLLAQQRLSGGYVGNFAVGTSALTTQSLGGFLRGERVSVRELIARLNQSFDVDSGFNRKMQFMVSMENESLGTLASAVPVTDVLDIFAGTFSIEDPLSEQFNSYDYTHTQDYFKRDSSGWRLHATALDQESIDGY